MKQAKGGVRIIMIAHAHSQFMLLFGFKHGEAAYFAKIQVQAVASTHGRHP